MNKEIALQLNKIRDLCLKNVESLLKASLLSLENSLDHISFHLSTLALEEIGKISIVTIKLLMSENQSEHEVNLDVDDHEKKLFWSIYGPTFGKKKLSKVHIEQSRDVAKAIHERRMEYLYINPEKPIIWSQIMKDGEAKGHYDFAYARYQLEMANNGLPTDISDENKVILKWFANISEDLEKRKMIFSNKSQEKLIELGNMFEWVKWLKKIIEKNDEEIKKLVEKELQRNQSTVDAEKPKWRIRYRLISPSHSIRSNVLNEFNKRSHFIKLYKGGPGNHTLMVEIILLRNFPAQLLWDNGWMICRHFTTALCIGSKGFFWWNTPLDTAKYYEEIWDFENKLAFKVEINPALQLNWKELKLKLDNDNLQYTSLVYNYFSQILQTKEFEPVNEYIIGLTMLAKSDIHFRLEVNSFDQFFKSFKMALLINGDYEPSKENIKEAGLRQIRHTLPHYDKFNKLMDLGEALQVKGKSFTKPITLTEVFGMKHYCDLYFIILAARKLR